MDKAQQRKIDIVRCTLIKEKSLKYQEAITSSDMAASIFREYIGDCDREVFAVIGVDVGNRLTFLNIVSIGQLGEARANMRELFKPAILSNSASIIIGHNHPGGTLMPSEEDLLITNKIKKVGQLFGIGLLDHIIVTTDDTMSIREQRPDMFD